MLVALDQSVPVKDLGGTGVDPKKEEPLISQHSGNFGKVLPNVALSSMLENLNRNDIRIASPVDTIESLQPTPEASAPDAAPVDFVWRLVRCRCRADSHQRR